jgi:hypothetical protein
VRKRSPSRSVLFYSPLFYATVCASGSAAQHRSGHGMSDCLSLSEKGEEEEEEEGWGVVNYPAQSHPRPSSPSPSRSLPLHFRVSLPADTLTSHPHITSQSILSHCTYAMLDTHTHTPRHTPSSSNTLHITHYTASYILHCTVPFFEYVTVQRTMISSTINTTQTALPH